MIEFIKKRSDLGQWDPNLILNDIQGLFLHYNTSWLVWQNASQIACPGSEFNGSIVEDCNLTYAPHLDVNHPNLLWQYSGLGSGLGQYGLKVTDNDMYELIPFLHGTYLGGIIQNFQEIFGPVRARIQMRSVNRGLYWHADPQRREAYHMALWTNPGHMMVWSEDYWNWQTGFDPKLAKKDMRIHAKYVPLDGCMYEMRTDLFLHGVASIGIGWRAKGLTSRGHLSICPVDPNKSQLISCEEKIQ
jgi:hypothetical protein